MFNSSWRETKEKSISERSNIVNNDNWDWEDDDTIYPNEEWRRTRPRQHHGFTQEQEENYDYEEGEQISWEGRNI